MVDLNPDPMSTWGATPAYKEAWNEKYGAKDEDGNLIVAPAAPNESTAGQGAGTAAAPTATDPAKTSATGTAATGGTART